MNDKNIGCMKGDLAIAKSPNLLLTLCWHIFAPVIVAVVFSFAHGWSAWAIVAAVAIGAGGVRWIWRKVVPPYVIV